MGNHLAETASTTRSALHVAHSTDLAPTLRFADALVGKTARVEAAFQAAIGENDRVSGAIERLGIWRKSASRAAVRRPLAGERRVDLGSRLDRRRAETIA